MPVDRSFRIGAWRVRPRLNRISDGERIVHIEPKVMKVLLCLAEEAGQVVQRKELLDAVWPDTVVGDEVLSRAVSELRRAFGDDARNPRIIETIPKSGYRLMAPVDFEMGREDQMPAVAVAAVNERPGAEDYSGGIDMASASRTKPAGHGRWRRPAGMIGIVLLTLILAAAAYILADRPSSILADRPSSEAWVALRTAPATTFRGTEFHPALSPEGERLAFIWTGPDDGHLDLYVKTLTSETPLRLTDGPFYEYSPSWSPDGTEIAFGRYGTGIFVIPALGGPERRIAGVEATARPHVDWSPTGESLLYTDREAADRPYRLHLLSLAGGQPRVLTSPPTTYEGDSAPAFAPDGRRIAFVRTSSGAADIYVSDIEEPAPKRLTFDAAEIAGLDWSEDGRQVLFASTRQGRFAIWRIPYDGGEPELVTSAPGSDLLQPSRRANRIAYTQRTTDANIWQVQPGHEPAALLASTRIDANAHYSLDGKRIAFISSRSGPTELWISGADGSEPVKLTTFEGTSVANPRWSPDGAAIAFDAGAMGQSDVYVLRLEDRSLWRMTAADAADVAPSWSIDGTTLYFGSNRSGSWQVWSMPAAGGVQFRNQREPGRARGARDRNRVAEGTGGQHVEKATATQHADAGSGTQHAGHGTVTEHADPEEVTKHAANRTSRQHDPQIDRAVQITRNGGFFARETSDGSLLFTRRGESGLHRHAPDGTDHMVVEELSTGDWSNWALAGNRLYYVDRSEEVVFARDLTSGTTERYVELPQLPAWGIGGLTVSPTGAVLYTRVDHSTFDIMVLSR